MPSYINNKSAQHSSSKRKSSKNQDPDQETYPPLQRNANLSFNGVAG
jgi:hypothetical protein